jgi:hypothetical protein
VALSLLQMLGLQQHALTPNNLFSPTHGFSIIRFGTHWSK